MDGLRKAVMIITRLYNDVVSNTEVLCHQMRWEGNHESKGDSIFIEILENRHETALSK